MFKASKPKVQNEIVRCRHSGSWCQIQAFWVINSKCQVYGFEVRCLGLEGIGFTLCGLRHWLSGWVWGYGFGVKGNVAWVLA